MIHKDSMETMENMHPCKSHYLTVGCVPQFSN